jgi:hypothetical protein
VLGVAWPVIADVPTASVRDGNGAQTASTGQRQALGGIVGRPTRVIEGF